MKSKLKSIIENTPAEIQDEVNKCMDQLEKENSMKQLIFNNTQLLFVGVPMDRNSFNVEAIGDHYMLVSYTGDAHDTMSYVWEHECSLNERYTILGTIQKSNGIVSTTIPDEVLISLLDYTTAHHNWTPANVLLHYMEVEGLTLQEGEKKVVLKIK